VVARAKPQKIRLKLKAGETIQDAWDGYFAALKTATEEQRAAASAAVRVAASDLFAREQHQELIALIQAALRQGFPQTWMYEGLGLSLKANGAPAEEVERALMSAVDFANSLDDVLYVAVFMTHLGLDARALKLYREVAAAQPFRPEPFMQGLAAAQRLNDLAGIKWACVGILRQAWTKNDQQVAESVMRTAKATYGQLVAEKRQPEADEFKQQVDRAMIRDCIIHITGPARRTSTWSWRNPAERFARRTIRVPRRAA